MIVFRALCVFTFSLSQATNSTVYFATMLTPLEKLATIIEPLSKEITERSARVPLLLSKSQIFKPHFISPKDALKENAMDNTVISALLASILPDKEPLHNYPSCSIVGNSKSLLQGKHRKLQKREGRGGAGFIFVWCPWELEKSIAWFMCS